MHYRRFAGTTLLAFAVGSGLPGSVGAQAASPASPVNP
jgi:hypothetical protein